MNKKNIFKPDIGVINNNEKTYYSFLNKKDDVRSHDDPISFINKLNKDGKYIFNKSVVIKTKDNLYDTKIAGKIGNRIITLDDQSINIKDIIDIYEK